jgi:hypothetical protein
MRTSTARLLGASATTALVASLLVGTLPGVAGETPPKLTVDKIATTTTPYKAKAVVKPTYTATGSVEVASATLTVKQKGKTLKKNVKSVKLAPGAYTVTQKVKYKTYTYKDVKTTEDGTYTLFASGTAVPVVCLAVEGTAPTSTRSTNWVTVVANCHGEGLAEFQFYSNWFKKAAAGQPWEDESSVGGDTSKLRFAAFPNVGDVFSAEYIPAHDITAVGPHPVTTQKKVYSKVKVKTKTQKLTVKAGKKPAKKTKSTPTPTPSTSSSTSKTPAPVTPKVPKWTCVQWGYCTATSCPMAGGIPSCLNAVLL